MPQVASSRSCPATRALPGPAPRRQRRPGHLQLHGRGGRDVPVTGEAVRPPRSADERRGRPPGQEDAPRRSRRSLRSGRTRPGAFPTRPVPPRARPRRRPSRATGRVPRATEERPRTCAASARRGGAGGRASRTPRRRPPPARRSSWASRRTKTATATTAAKARPIRTSFRPRSSSGPSPTASIPGRAGRRALITAASTATIRRRRARRRGPRRGG